jgi:hypothetical protein
MEAVLGGLLVAAAILEEFGTSDLGELASTVLQMVDKGTEG